jgi:hypothetical protein
MCGRFTYKLTWSEIPRLEWGWRDDIQARLPKWGIGRYRLEAAGFGVPEWANKKLDEGQKSEFACPAAQPGWQLVT